MNKLFGSLILVLCFIGCSKNNNDSLSPESSAVNAEVEESSSELNPEETFETYSAAAFLQTTSYSVPSSSGYTYSPDGEKILVTSDETGVYNVYAMSNTTGETVQLTHSTTTGNFASSFFPNDERILFVADNGGNELVHVWVRELNGEVTDLTSTENTRALFGGWSQDNSEFFVATNERNPRQMDLYAYNSKDYSRRLVYQNDEAYGLGPMSRDNRWLSLIKPISSANSDLYLKDLNSDEPAQLITEHEGNITYSVYDFTPDNKKLLIRTDEAGEFFQAWQYDLEEQTKSPYLTADWDVSFVGFSHSGRYQFHGVNVDASTAITITDLNTQKTVELPTLPNGDIGNIRFSKDDSKLTLLLSSDTTPRDIYTVTLGGEAQRLTNAINPEINPANLVESEVVRYKSFDGLDIPSILYKPKQASADNPVPALVFVHGGPGGQTRTGYSAMVQHLVNHGYAVLGANNRGSSGYGKTFYHLDDKAHGEGDLQDIVWGKKYLQSLDWVAGDKIGIIGGSYGGYMVAAALAFEPEEFEVGIDIFGVTNWVRTLKSIPPWWEAQKDALYDEMGDPATDEERHRRISPLFHAQNIIKPLLVIQGANDPRVLQVESDELVEKVKANGTPVEYIVFPDEGHGFRSRENRITASDAYVSFLNKYLRRSGE